MKKHKNTRELINDLSVRRIKGKVLVLNPKKVGKYRDIIEKQSKKYIEYGEGLVKMCFEDDFFDTVVFLETIEFNMGCSGATTK